MDHPTATKRINQNPLDALLAFHERVRLALAHLRRLSRQTPQSVEPIEVLALADFFRRELSAHDIDEERSLLPRLTPSTVEPKVMQAVRRCRRGHLDLEALIDTTIPHLELVGAGQIPLNRERLQELSRALEPALLAHLKLEEVVLFPAARRVLDATDLKEIAAEITERRQTTLEREAAMRAHAADPSAEPTNH